MSVRPQSANWNRCAQLAHTKTTSESLRSSSDNVSSATLLLSPSTPSGRGASDTIKTLRPRFVFRGGVKMPNMTDDMENLSSGTDSFIVSPPTSPMAPRRPTDPTGGSLRTLLAAHRVAKALGATSSRRGGVTQQKSGDFPHQPTTSRFLASASQNVSLTPLQFVLDIGSAEVDTVQTMERCVKHLKAYLQQCADSVERQSERVQAVLGQLKNSKESGPQPFSSDVAERVRRRVGSVSNLTMLNRPAVSSPRHVQPPKVDLCDDASYAHSNDSRVDGEHLPPAPELLHQVACELVSLIPSRLPDVVLCYWDFTLSGTLEESLSSAFAPLGSALENSRVLLMETNQFLKSLNSPRAAVSPNNETRFDESVVLSDERSVSAFQLLTPRNNTDALATFKEIPLPPLCAVTWRLQYCRLRGVSFAELPLSFNPPAAAPTAAVKSSSSSSSSPVVTAGTANSDATEAAVFQMSFRIGGMTVVSPRAARPIASVLEKSPCHHGGYGGPSGSPNQVPPTTGAFRLVSLSLSHCVWRESSKFGLQQVLRVSGWGIEELELRGAQMSDDLVRSVAGVLLTPTAVLERVTWANCKGWSTTDAGMQLLLMDALRGSRCVRQLVLQGVPIPPKAGIALLDAVQHNPVVDQVRLESCHFVTPKFLATLQEKLQSAERRAQPSPLRGRRSSMSTTVGGLDGTRRSSFASLMA